MPDRIGSNHLLKVEHMKIKNGVNPDYADFDEIDTDVEDAILEFESGTLTFDELKALVGPEAAQSLAEKHADYDPYALFDDPEDF